MGLPPGDFKSPASTDFATRAEMKPGSGDHEVAVSRAVRALDPLNPRSLDPGSQAGNGTRTRDPNLGKVVLYQLSYSRARRKLAITIACDKHDTRSGTNAERVHRVPD